MSVNNVFKIVLLIINQIITLTIQSISYKPNKRLSFVMNTFVEKNIPIDVWKEEITSNGEKKVFHLENKFEKRGYYISFVNTIVPCLWLCVLNDDIV